MSPQRLKPLLAAVVLAAAVASVLPGTARPAYPGANGKLVFISERDDPFGDIYTMSADGTGSVTRFGVDRIVDQTPAWSPDGTKIAFGSRRDLDDIYVMDADGGNVRRLTTDFATEYSPTWSPDGSKIAFVSDRDGNNEIYVMNADGTDQRRLTNYPGSDDEPAWSTDGTRIAFNSPRDGCFKEVYVMDAADGGNVTKLVPGCVFSADASWSPDGTKVAFDRGNGQREISVVDLASGAETALTNTGRNTDPAWSPDGSKIAFTSFRDGNAELYVMDANGGNQTRLTSNAVTDFEPDWQPIPPPPGPCIVLSGTAVDIGGTASTPSTRRTAESERVTVRNCGDAAVKLAARGTDATGTAGSWRLTNDSSGGPGDSPCELGANVFRADVTLWLSGGPSVSTALSTRDTLLEGPNAGAPFSLGAAANEEFSVGVDLPCAGSVGLGEPMTTDLTLTALSP